MAENYITCVEEKGTINISDDVIATMVKIAVKEIDGVAGMAITAGPAVSDLLNKKTSSKGVKVSFGENSMIIDREGAVLLPDTPVSMNLWGFTPDLITESSRRFASFLEKNLYTSPDCCEYYIPSLVSELIAEGKIKVKVIETNEKWYGVTYKKDKSEVALALENMVNDGVYPRYL